jgi:hypothetical protein
VLGLSSAKTGDEIKSQAEQSIHRRKRGSNWFSHLISFTPSFGFALPAASLLLMFFIISRVSLDDYHPANPDPMPGFIETIPSFAHFSATWKLGMKQG